jgi:divalent metal cation (Fe/Co/Zn/Cd) transporter
MDPLQFFDFMKKALDLITSVANFVNQVIEFLKLPYSANNPYTSTVNVFGVAITYGQVSAFIIASLFFILLYALTRSNFGSFLIAFTTYFGLCIFYFLVDPFFFFVKENPTNQVTSSVQNAWQLIEPIKNDLLILGVAIVFIIIVTIIYTKR